MHQDTSISNDRRSNVGERMTIGIGRKLLAGFAIVLLLFTGAGTFSIVALGKMADSMDGLYSRHVEPLNDASDAGVFLVQLNLAAEESNNARSPEERARDLQNIA